MKEILLVDDDQLFLKSLTRTLTSENYKVDQATSGEEALKKLKEKDFNLVILDYKMKSMDGLEVLRRIRKNEYNCGVIMISAYGTFDMAAEAIAHDAVTVLPKPIEMDRLKSEVKRAIREQLLSNMKKKKKKTKPPKREKRKRKSAKRKSRRAGKKSDTDELKEVLVVDDSRAFRKMIINTISSEFDEFTFVQAVDGADALDKLSTHDIKFIVLDINMPHMTGIEFMKLKRKSDKFKDVPVVILTTERQRETMRKAYLSGATVYVNKPFKHEELIKVIKTMIYWHVK